MIGHLILRLVIWFLLTANFTIANILIGIAIAFLLPRGYPSTETLKDWLQLFRKLLLAIPIAYLEAFEMIVRPHTQEGITVEQVRSKRSPSLVFLDIFLITFTPKTIVLKHRQDGSYIVHQVTRRSKT